MQMAASAGDDIKGRDLLAGFVHDPVPLILTFGLKLSHSASGIRVAGLSNHENSRWITGSALGSESLRYSFRGNAARPEANDSGSSNSR